MRNKLPFDHRGSEVDRWPPPGAADGTVTGIAGIATPRYLRIESVRHRMSKRQQHSVGWAAHLGPPNLSTDYFSAFLKNLTSDRCRSASTSGWSE